jgi:hypothetical protein
VKQVWRSVGRSPKKAILTYFGDSAIITDHGGTMTLIFRTPTFDDNLASTAKERFATANTLEHFTLRLSRRPRATLAPAPDQGPPATGSPRRSPPRAARPAPSTPSKRPSLLAPDSPTKKHKLGLEDVLASFTELDITNPEENIIILGGKVYVSNMFSPKLISRSIATRRKKAYLVGSCIDEMLNRKKASFPLEVQDIISAFISMNPQIPMAKMEMLLGLGRFATLKELDGLVDEHTHKKSVPKTGKFRWTTGSYKVSMEAALKGSPSATTLENWLQNLAVDQAVMTSYHFENKNVFYQQDGGQHNQDVKFVTCWDAALKGTEGGGIRIVLVDVDTSATKGAKSDAAGAKKSLAKVGVGCVSGITCDSGGGTPESLLREMKSLNLLSDFPYADSVNQTRLRNSTRKSRAGTFLQDWMAKLCSLTSRSPTIQKH